MLRPFRMFRLSLIVVLLGTVASNLSANPVLTPPRGTLIESTQIGSYTREQLDARFQRLGLKARNGIKLFRVSYQSQIAPGRPRPTEASGLVIIPDVPAQELPWISLQHGTVAGKKEAPSLSASEGLYEASQGYVTAVADYLGYGSSAALFHPYLIAEAYVPVGVDLLRATRSLAAQQKIELGPLFLRGYSEGGYATLALQKALETRYRKEFPLKGSAPAAGPYDIEIAATVSLSRPTTNAMISTFLVLAYDQWLAPQIDLTTVFAIDADELQKLYNSGLSTAEILQGLPTETRKLVDGAFLDDFLSAQPTRYQARLIRHLLVDQSLTHDSWAPAVSTRFYHCVDDEIVSVKATEYALAHFAAIKADAPITSVIAASPDASHPYTHGTCPLIFASVAWFDELLAK